VAEVRITHFLTATVLAGIVAFLVCSCGLGMIAVGPFKKETTDYYLSSVMGFPPAKTPAEAMDKFREAIQARKYTTAARYVTKPYKELLERANPGATEMGAVIDKIYGYAKDNGYVTDKLAFAMYRLDPFPRNFKSGKPPEVKGDKAYGQYQWEDPPDLKNKNVVFDQEWKSMDPAMFRNIYAPSAVFGFPIELVKEGEEWKLNIPTNPEWETSVGYFNDNYKRYYNGLTAFKGDMLNNRYPAAKDFEEEVLKAIRNAKK
jgi:hypothetical protein